MLVVLSKMTNINKLVLNGFKSFGKWTEVPFTGGFNVVLGPNGSGKSNILDALCFVLGRMSSKSMRAEKLGYLVYNGGKNKKPAVKAEVSIFFDNSSKVFPVDAPLVKVTRLVKADGQSVYRINDERRTRQQVLDLLAFARIDPEGHNIILQGDVIRFVEMSPEERRQVVEEIAGISVYEDKKQKAMSEIGKVEQSLREAAILLSERKAHLSDLKRDRDQAIRYRELNDKVRQSRATLLSLQVSRRESEKSSFERSLSEQAAEIDKQRSEIVRLKYLASEKKSAIAEVSREIEEKGEHEQVRLHREIEELRVEIGTSGNRLSMCDSELQKIASRRAGLAGDLSELDSKVSSLTGEVSALEKARNERLVDKARVESSIDRIRKDSKVADIGDMEAGIESVEKELDSLLAETQGIVERRQFLLREKDRLEVQLQSIDSQISKMSELEKANKGELDSIKARREKFKALVLELNQRLSEDSVLAARLADSKRRLESAEEELIKARAKATVTRETNLAVQKVLELKARIKGIYGSVADLGRVDSRYALALEVAAGPRINSIVVQNEDVAAECIKYLKQGRFGVATFLPLNRLKQESEARQSKASGVHGLAVDLVSFEPEFRKVFNYVFGSTLVVDNIDVARRIGVGSARMVTVDGDLLELSGAMHGGFRQKRASLFQEERAEKELKEKEAVVSELEAAVSSLERQRAEAEASISSLRQRKAELEGEIIKSEKSLFLDSGDMDASVRQKELLSAHASDVSSQLSSVQSVLDGKNRLIAEIKTRRQRLRDEISRLRNPAVVAELNAFEQKRQQLVEEVIGLDGQIKSLELQLSGVAGHEKERILSILKQLGKEEEDFNAEKVRLASSIEQSRKLLKEAVDRSALFQKKHREMFDSKSRLVDELQGIDAQVIRKEEQINTLEVRMNNFSIKNAEAAAVVAGLRHELEQYSGVQLLEEASEDRLKEHIYRHERSLSEMGNVNLKALEVYEEVERQYNELLEKKELLEKEKTDVLRLMEEIEVKKKELFLNTFTVINDNFMRIFREISAKGEATLVLEDPERIFESGVRIRVNLTGDKFLDIRGLSGGEKSMTALALIFAIQEYSPASFYIFDEVDASLDKKNSEKLSSLIRKYSERAQYIVISHNDGVLSSASTLFGVSMNEDGISSLVSLKA
ncbi:chromosome segregation protein SMC [Candidatus Woesearchaeota archaeon]|nr:chromosome segregation protein SMC [Candidatus Woesearchaeota archaeon]